MLKIKNYLTVKNCNDRKQKAKVFKKKVVTYRVEKINQGYVMSINSINGVNNFGYAMPSDPIKPETKRKLRELGIDENSVRTETQAQNKIKEKVVELQQQLQERVQAEAATQHVQVTDISQFVQGVNSMPVIQPANQLQQVEGLGVAQQIQQPQGIEAQNGLQDKQVSNDQTQAFAGSASAQQPEQAKPFELSSDIIALQNKLKLGLAI